MYKESIDIGPTPGGESCAQVGIVNYRQVSSKEMDIYIAQIYRKFPELENHASIFLKKAYFPHDFGSYGEVVIVFDADNKEVSELAYKIEANLPEFWDDISQPEIDNLYKTEVWSKNV